MGLGHMWKLLANLGGVSMDFIQNNVLKRWGACFPPKNIRVVKQCLASKLQHLGGSQYFFCKLFKNLGGLDISGLL